MKRGIFILSSVLALLLASQGNEIYNAAPPADGDAEQEQDAPREVRRLPTLSLGTVYPASAGANSLDELKQAATNFLAQAQPLLNQTQQVPNQLTQRCWFKNFELQPEDQGLLDAWSTGEDSFFEEEEDIEKHDLALCEFQSAFDQMEYAKVVKLLEDEYLDLEDTIDYIIESKIETAIGLLFVTSRVRELPAISFVKKDFAEAHQLLTDLLVDFVVLMPLPSEDWSNVASFFKHSAEVRPGKKEQELLAHKSFRSKLYIKYPLMEVIMAGLKHHNKQILLAAFCLPLMAIEEVNLYLKSYACINGNLELFQALMDHQNGRLVAEHLALAVIGGSTELVKLLLDSDKRSGDWDFSLALYWALARGNVPMLELLFGHPKIQAQLPDWDCYCDGLAVMVADGHQEAFEWALIFLTPDHSFSFKGNVLFDIAAGHGRLGIIKALLRRSHQDPTLAPKSSAVLFALFAEHLDVLSHLLYAPLYQHLEDYEGPKSDLELLVGLHLYEPALLKKLGAVMEASEPARWTVLLGSLIMVQQEKQEAIMKEFQTQGIVNWADYPYALLDAVLGRNMTALLFLLMQAQVEPTRPIGCLTAPHLMILQERHKQELLLPMEPLISIPLLNVQAYKGTFDALILASIIGDATLVSILVDAVAEPDPMAISMAFAWAHYYGHAEVIEQLEAAAGLNQSFGLMGAALACRKDVVEAFLAKGVALPADLGLVPCKVDEYGAIAFGDRPLPLLQFVGVMTRMSTTDTISEPLQAIFTLLGGTAADLVDPNTIVFKMAGEANRVAVTTMDTSS